jgi:hypothetical protein
LRRRRSGEGRGRGLRGGGSGRRGRLGGDLLVARQSLRLRADNLRLDHDIIGAADHQEMFDIVAAHDDELALAVERESVDQAEPRLARPAPARKSQPMAKQQAIGDNERYDRDDGERREHRYLQPRFVAIGKIS